MKKFILFFLLLGLFIFPINCQAKVWINEFSSASNPEWVELYNDSDSEVDLEGWILVDAAENEVELSGTIDPNAFRSFSPTATYWLNNHGDEIILKNLSGEEDSYTYTEDLAENESMGRSPDGSDYWMLFDPSQRTKDGLNYFSPTNTPTETPESSPTGTPTSEPDGPTSAYEIREVKDEGGNDLSNVKVYVDDVYVNHYAPETLIFCEGCRCNDKVDCDLGEHTFKLEKSGYDDWTITVDIEEAKSYQVDPIMIKVEPTKTPTNTPKESPTPTPTKTVTPTPTPKKSPTPTPEMSPTLIPTIPESESDLEVSGLGDVLGETSKREPKDKGKLIAGGFIGMGGLLLGGVGFGPKIKEIFDKMKSDEESKQVS